MIERIVIANCASYAVGPEVFEGLSTFNFIYGPNGSGKSTVARIINDAGPFAECSIQWQGGTKLQTLVYNRDFVDANFTQSPRLKGIFTLGAKNIQTLNEIESTKREIDKLRETIEALSNTLHGGNGTGGKIAELANAEQTLKDACWELKQRYDNKFDEAFTGYRADAEKFKRKLLEECNSNSYDLRPLVDLEKRAESVFGPAPTTESLLSDTDEASFIKFESDPILQRRIIGKADVDIARLIQELGSSDWVKEGVHYFEMSDGVCPFCQQPVPHDLMTRLSEYFDGVFQKDSEAIATLLNNYRTDGERIQTSLLKVLDSGSTSLDAASLRAKMNIFDVQLQLNIQKLEAKRKEPSQVIELQSSSEMLKDAKRLIDEANEKTSSRNALVSNFKNEQETLTGQIWKFLADVEIKQPLETYKKISTSINAGITSLRTKIDEAIIAKKTKEDRIRALEKRTTSIEPTVDAINKLLSSFGFRTFSLATGSDGKSYMIRRPDGSDAKATLSEGEFSFISFLYFFHLLRGSDSSSGITVDRVVVFDDPVSSLDSDILFVVSSLIKSVFEDVREKRGNIKQVFVFTHNVYFHKEVSFNSKRSGVAMKEETFWTISKLNDASHVAKHTTNPIKTSYDLLWNDVRSPNTSSQTLQNTLRRILESYFRILGNQDSDAICEKFEGPDKIICRALFSWVNDGSHSDLDDLYISSDGTVNEKYLSVFREIFERTGHMSHYKMMMGDRHVEEAIPTRIA